jgi:hypothetical protein
MVMGWWNRRALLPGFDLCEILGPADQGARSVPAVPPSDQWRSSSLPALRRPACASARHGRGLRVCVRALWNGVKAEAMLSGHTDTSVTAGR